MDNQLGNGVGGHWFSTNLTALMDGEYAVLEGNYWLSEGGIDLLGCHADVNYFVEIMVTIGGIQMRISITFW